MAKKQSFASRIGKGALGLLGSLLDPFRKGTGIGTELAVQIKGRGKSEEEKEKLRQQLRATAAKPLTLTPEETTRLQQAPVREVGKTIAGQAAFAVPGGQATGLARVGAAAGGGALAGLGASEPGEELQATAGGAAIGGAIGGAFEGLSKFRNLFTGKTAETGAALRQGVRKPRVQATPFAADEERLISSALDDLGIKGSAQRQKNTLPGAFRKIQSQIDDVVGKSKETVGVRDVRNGLEGSIDDLINFDPGIPAFTRAKSKWLNQIEKQAKNGQLSVKELVTIKQGLNKQLKRAFTKLDKGTIPLTPAEEVGMAVWGTIDDLLPGSVKELSRKQSMLFKAAPGIIKQVERPGGVPIPFTGGVGGAKLGGRPIQAGKDITGRALQKGAEVIEKIPQLKDLPPTLKNAIIAKIAGATEAPPAEEPVVQEGAGGISPEVRASLPEDRQRALDVIDQAEAGGAQAGGQVVSEDQLIQVLLNPDISEKTKNRVAQVFELQQSKAKPLSATTENRVQLGQSGLRALDEIEVILKEDPSKVFKAAVPGQLGARDYDSAAFRAVEGLLRARSGAAVPDSEIRSYMRANLPRIGDTPEDIQFKLEAFRKDLEAIAQSGGTGSQGLDDILQAGGL